MLRRRFRMAVALCFLAAASLACLPAISPVMAKHRSSHASKHKGSKHKSSSRIRKKSDATEQKPLDVIGRTPVHKQDCIAVSQTIYGQAKTVSRQARQSIPKEFERVVSNLDEFCGEEEFDKARITIDWMNTCLQNFTKDLKLGFCSRTQSYFCAIGPASEACQSQ